MLDEKVEYEFVREFETQEADEHTGQMRNVTMKVYKCPEHGEFSVRFCGIYTFVICEKCNEEKNRMAEDEEQKRARLAVEKQAKELEERMSNPEILDKMGICEEFHNASFENWIPEDKEPMKSFQQKAKDGVMAAMKRRSGLILLLGGNGTRKTSLVCAALRSLGEGTLISMYECAFRLRTDNCKEEDALSGLSFLWFLKKTPVLCIDEIGMTSNTDADKQWLMDVINTRSSRRLLTFLVSNSPLRSMAPKDYNDVVLDDVLGKSVMSRLQYAEIYRVSGTDFRQINTQEN